MRNFNFLVIGRVFFLFSILPFSIKAQRLPAIQENSVRAPANIKIDGNEAECFVYLIKLLNFTL